jgi:hypothetical protein
LHLFNLNPNQNCVGFDQNKSLIINQVDFVEEEQVHIRRCQARRIIFFRLILPEIEQKVLLAFNMLRVVMIKPPQVQVLLSYMFLSERVSILLIHNIQDVKRWLAMQLLSSQLQLAQGAVGSLNHISLIPRRDLWLVQGLWKCGCLYDWMLVESFWRVVFQEVGGHGLH